MVTAQPPITSTGSGRRWKTRAGGCDTHTHIVPPDYSTWLKRRSAEAGGLPIPGWSVDLALASMEARSVRTSIVSVSTPGVHFGDDAEARAMARLTWRSETPAASASSQR